MTTPCTIVLCRCRYGKVAPPEAVRAVEEGLAAAGASAVTVDDLCGLAARRDTRLAAWSSGELRIAACFPRAVRWMLAWAGVRSPLLRLANLRTDGPEKVLEQLLRGVGPAETVGEAPAAPSPGELAADWMPWFPVIDYDRCTGCGQCLNFCLFGVYRKQEEQVVVGHPRGCKTHCPACARVCPSAAIIFPKYGAGPINGALSGPEPTGVNVREALGAHADAYAALRQRSKPPQRQDP